MFIVGDKVAYPMHGAGVIESIEEKEILGERKQYYVLRFALGGMKVMVPVSSVEEVGLRDIIPDPMVFKVIEFLKKGENTECDNWNRRYRDNLDKMKTGDIFEVADVVRMLSLRDKDKGLSTGERKMLNNARQILLSELVLASGKDEDEIQTIVSESI